MTSLHKKPGKKSIQNLTISHTGGRLSSDSGLVLVKEVMNTFDFSHVAIQWLHIKDKTCFTSHMMIT